MAGKPKGRKIKLSQAIALAPEFRDTLEEFKVIKGPVVPKFEQLDKYIVGRGWKLSFSDGAGDDGGASATIRTPGSATSGVYEATGETAAHAITYALCEALRAEPKQQDLFDEKAKQPPADPTGADTPLFRGNGGVASVAEQEIERNRAKASAPAPEIDPDPDEIEFDDEQLDLEDQLDRAIKAGDAEDAGPEPDPILSPIDGWQFLYVVDPLDVPTWKSDPPLVDDNGGVPNLLIAWQEGDDGTEFDRGFYLKPGYQYLREVGEIRRRDPNGGLPKEIVWSRERKNPISEIKNATNGRRSRGGQAHPLTS